MRYELQVIVEKRGGENEAVHSVQQSTMAGDKRTRILDLHIALYYGNDQIAERRGHPQADAIKTLCLLSLVFGGLFWPLAWLWAYSKPVLHKMAYGTDRIEHGPAPVVADPTHAGGD